MSVPTITISGGDAAERVSLSKRIREVCSTYNIQLLGEVGDMEAAAALYSAAPQPDTSLTARLGMDAEKWAVEFGTRFAGNTVNLEPLKASLQQWVDKADLIGWFAKAIMAGYDRGREQGEKEERERVRYVDVMGDSSVVIEREPEPLAVAPEGAKRRLTASNPDLYAPFSGKAVTKIATLLVPRIDNDGHNLDAEHAALQVELIGIFGGYTATHTTGGWRDGLTIYRDDVTKYEIAVRAFDTTVERDLQRVAARMSRICGQKCIMLWLPDGTVICVDAEGGVC